jgi:hypothetical protein
MIILSMEAYPPVSAPLVASAGEIVPHDHSFSRHDLHPYHISTAGGVLYLNPLE